MSSTAFERRATPQNEWLNRGRLLDACEQRSPPADGRHRGGVEPSLFGVEAAVFTHIGSVSPLADSIDFLDEAAVNALIWLGLRRSARNRAKLGMALAAILLVPAMATHRTARQHWRSNRVPAPLPLTVTGFGALLVNVSCALLLAKIRHVQASLTRAASLSGRNDAIANVAIIGAGVVTAFQPSAWPDLIVGIGISSMNLDAAREVFEVARREHEDARRAFWQSQVATFARRRPRADSGGHVGAARTSCAWATHLDRQTQQNFVICQALSIVVWGSRLIGKDGNSRREMPGSHAP